MKVLKDWEIFLLAIKASGKVPYKNHSSMQTGLFIGVAIGAIMVRDNISLDEAKEKELVMRDLFYPKWTKGEILTPKPHFKNEALTMEKIDRFAERMIKLREKFLHYRNDLLTESEIYEIACTDKYFNELFTRKYNDASVNLKDEINPYFTTEFNGVMLDVDENSTTESIVAQYKLAPIGKLVKN